MLRKMRFVLVESKKLQICRMCQQVGLHIVGLKRIRIGQEVLCNLPVQQWRYLRAGESFAYRGGAERNGPKMAILDCILHRSF
jgi:16S rRNA U516 pseudouridylate synthase RsuA-like enzyme